MLTPQKLASMSRSEKHDMLKRKVMMLRSVSSLIDQIVEDGGRITLTDPLSIRFSSLRRQIKQLRNSLGKL